ncbi:hypothetical protein Ancab_001855, partial [Ancistrocladus abbreviatus]
MTTFACAPPAATVLSFLPKDNSIIAIGLGDSTIRIYNIRQVEILSKLEGHNQRITSIAFSSELYVLVSAGADCQLPINVDELLQAYINHSFDHLFDPDQPVFDYLLSALVQTFRIGSYSNEILFPDTSYNGFLFHFDM